MILRLRRKPGEQQRAATAMPPKKNRNEKRKKKKKKVVDGVPDSPIPQDVIDVLLERFSPVRENPFSKKKKSIEEQEESDHEECSRKRKRKRKKSNGKRTENGEKGKSKKTKNGKETKENNNFHERYGIVDPPSQSIQRAEDRLAISIEQEPETVTPNFGEQNYQGCGLTQSTRVLKPSTTNSSKRRKSRGVTAVLDITEDTSGVRMVIEYNMNGQPTGFVAKRFSSFLGVLGRRMVPIIHETWHKVPKELKEILLNHVEAKYVIDSKRRKTVLTAIGGRWKSFKTNLTRFFITPFKDQPELLRCPPEQYNFIGQENWVAFVESRLSEEFQNKSKCGAERRAKNIYNHRLSRKGYAGLIEELKQSLGTSVDEIDRSVLWKKARQNKEGIYLNDAVREKAAQIDELTKQKEDGNLGTQGDKDILTLALGTPEHSGRVRGVGHFVTPTSYFHLPKRNSKKYVGELEQKVNQQANKILEMNHTVQELQAQFDRISPQGPLAIPSSENIISNTNNSGSGKRLTTLSVENQSYGSQDESGYSDDDHPLQFGFEPDCQATEKGNTKCDMPPLVFNSRFGKSKQCRLAVDSKANIVARGMVFERVELNEKIHNVPLGENSVRVAVEYAISPNALLPVPVIGEMTMVKDAIGSCVAWPEEFVLTGVQEEENQVAGEKSGPIQAFASFVDQIMSTNNIIIPILNVIFEEEVEAYLQKNDLMYLCNMQEITATCIITYIRFLYDKLFSYQERYGFVNPASISSARGPDASSIITKRLQTARKDQLLFVPYNARGHWTLFIINSSSMDVYWLDPLQKPPSMDIKIYVTTGLKALRTDDKKRPNPTWHCVKCPKPSLDVQCGYYVMRYMRELVKESSRPLAEKILQLAENNTYSQDEVDETRLELIDFILTHM